MTMTVTFWWPIWGIRSYPIVTGWLHLSACRRLVLLISIIRWFIRIWPSIPNQFIIASYLFWFRFTVWVTRSRPHLNVFIYLWIYTATYVSYITEYGPCTWHHVAHLVFYVNLHIYIYIYIWQQATHSVGCKLFNVYCTVLGGMCSLHLKFILPQGVWFHEQSTTYSCASRVHSLQATKKYIHKFTETKMSSFLLLTAPEGNFLCSQWWKFHQNINISVPVPVQVESY